MRIALAAAGLLAGAFLLSFLVDRSPDVAAGTAVRLNLSELTHRADVIVEGRVLFAQALEANDGCIETEYILNVERTFVGDDQALRALRLPGGILPNGRGMMLAGMPGIAPGEHVLLFLSGEGSTGMRMPVGLAQGKLRVERTPSGAKVLVREQGGLSLLQPSGQIVPADGRQVLPYAEVVARIEAALATRGGGRK